MSRRGSILQDYGNIDATQRDAAQRDAAQYYQRDKELAAQQNNQKQNAKAKDGKDSLDYIDKLKVEPVGDTTVDLYNTAQLQKLKDDLLAKRQSGVSSEDIQIQAMQELPKIAKGYTIAKNEYGKIVEAQKNLLKDYPEGNAEAARNVMGKDMLTNIFEYNEDGTVKGYKDPSLINTNKSYSDVLFDPEKMDTWYPSTTDAVVANIQKTRGLTPIDGQVKVINPRGGYTDKKYKGHISIYDRPDVDSDGKISGISLDSESVPLGKNADGTANVIQVMPKEKYEVLRGDGKAAMQFDKAVYDHISKDLGVNPKSLDPQALDVYSRKYALEMLNKTGLQGSSYNQFDIEKADPVKNITNVRVNTGGAKEVPVMDIVTPVRSYFDNVGEQKEGLKGVAQINLFNNEVTTPVINEVKNRYPDITAEDIYYQKSGNDIWVMKAAETGKVDRQKDVPVFKLDEFSNVTGNKPQGQKSKNKALENAQSGKTDTKPTTGYTNVQTLQDSKGKSIQAGVKNGKWYDIKTGKPIE